MHSRSFSFVPILIGNWLQKEPSECAKRCGVGEGLSGTPGEVTCDSLSCDPDTKPRAKQCPATKACGTFDTDMPIVNRHSNHLLLPHRHHSQPSQAPHRSTPHMLARLFECAPIILISQCWVSCQGVLLKDYIKYPLVGNFVEGLR